MKKHFFASIILAISLTACKKNNQTALNNDTNSNDSLKNIGVADQNITDIDGNSYKTVRIGTQKWMAENLKVTRFNEGTFISKITDSLQWRVNNSMPAWTYYNNDSTNNSRYGKLYNWFAASKITTGNKNICPTGWHVPSISEWNILKDYLGGGSVAGGKLKEIGTKNWKSPNEGATNTSLFNARPGGFRYENGTFEGVGLNGSWWSTTEGTPVNPISPSKAFSMLVDNTHIYSSVSEDFKNIGVSIRCIQD